MKKDVDIIGIIGNYIHLELDYAKEYFDEKDVDFSNYLGTILDDDTWKAVEKLKKKNREVYKVVNSLLNYGMNGIVSVIREEGIRYKKFNYERFEFKPAVSINYERFISTLKKITDIESKKKKGFSLFKNISN